jgi:hypothetical protein
MSLAKLNNQNFILLPWRNTAAYMNSVSGIHLTGRMALATDTMQFGVSDGGHSILRCPTLTSGGVLSYPYLENSASKTGNYAASSTADYYIFTNSSGAAFSVTLPSPAGLAGRSLTIADVSGFCGSNAVTVSGTMRGGFSSFSLSENYCAAEFVSDGAEWFVFYSSTGHNHNAQYYPLATNPSGYAPLTPTSKSGIYNLSLPNNSIAFDTGDAGFYLVAPDGRKFFSPFNFVVISGSGADIGITQDSSPIGYGLDYVADKILSQCQIGSSDRTGVDGLIRFQDNAFQIWQNNAWSDVVIALRMREDDNGRYELEHKPIGFNNWYEIANGNSNELGFNGLPLTQQYVTSMGTYPVKIHVDGGTD